jgi:hypothetical protein
MEYYRASLIHWVELYFESEHPFHRSFGDVLNFCSDRFGRFPKSILTATANLLQAGGFSLASAPDKEYCRQKLQDLIFEMVYQFEKMFVDMGKDPTKCARIRHVPRLPDPLERDSVLRSFAANFHDTDECRERCTIENILTSSPYTAKLAAILAARAEGKPRQALEDIKAAISSGQSDPNQVTCRRCGKFGDAVVACSLGASWKLHSLDHVHVPIAEAIGLDYEIHPSIGQLRNELADGPADQQDAAGEGE